MVFRKFKGLSRDDQLVAGIVIAFFLVATSFYFWQRSITNSGFVDFEDMPQQPAVYLVDINQADWPEFANLPGIGEKLGKQIVDFRNENGPFRSADQLIEITGIGPAKLDAMRPFLNAEGGNTTD